VPGGREVLCERGWPRTGIEGLSSIEEAGEALVGVQEPCRRGIQSGYWRRGAGGRRWRMPGIRGLRRGSLRLSGRGGSARREEEREMPVGVGCCAGVKAECPKVGWADSIPVGGDRH
jgi:hypothetical protein